jgi:hypothetical protein
MRNIKGFWGLRTLLGLFDPFVPVGDLTADHQREREHDAMGAPSPVEALAADAGARLAHEHAWFECFRQAEPPARVLDCACGARRKVYIGAPSGQPEVEDVVPNPGGSINNCLVYVDGMDRASGLGDPQALSRLALLTKQSQQENRNG